MPSQLVVKCQCQPPCGLRLCGIGAVSQMIIIATLLSHVVSGHISYINVSLHFPMFYNIDNPTFTLVADTRGGPPTTHYWTRNNKRITSGSEFMISVPVLNQTEVPSLRYVESVYVSILIVTGVNSGFYKYHVSNKAMKNKFISDEIYIPGIW